MSATISGAIGLETGRIINNGLQPILNGITGSISQGWDSVAGSIKNVTGSWFGSGKYNPASPTDNIVSRVYDGEGGYIITDRTGSVTFTDGAGTITGRGPQTAVSGFNWPSFGSTASGINNDNPAGSPGYTGLITDGYGNPIQSGSGLYWGGGGAGTTFGPENNPIDITPTQAELEALYSDADYWI